MGLDQFKDKNGVTNFEQGRKYLAKERKKLSSTRGSSLTLRNHIIYHPWVPSEIFLVDQGNIFPTAEIQKRLMEIKSQDILAKLEKKVELVYNANATSTNGVDYKLDLGNKLTPINEFPWNYTTREGCPVIYEFPIIDPETGKVPEDMYIIGHDPVRTDDPSGPSLASIYVLKTAKYATRYGHNEIVASFVGRPFQGRNAVNDILLKLSLFYGNAKIFFENMVGNVKEYFEKKKKLSLLARQPKTVLTTKASFSTRDPLVYGYPMSNQKIKIEGLHYVRDWLLEERGEDADGRVYRNIDFIPDQGLLQELMAFNMDGNFDRVMGFVGCIIGIEESYNKLKEESTKPKDDSLDFILNNSSLFGKSPASTYNYPVATGLNFL